MSISGAISGQASLTAILRGSGLAPVPIHWTAASDAVDGYNIYRGATPGSETFKVNVALITGVTFVDYNAPPGLNYYVVKSSIQGVESQVSNEVVIGILQTSATGHATVGGTLHGNAFSVASAISRQASVSGTAKGAGVLAGAVTGHASVLGVPIQGQLLASVSGHAVVGGTIKGKGTLADAISRTATVGGTAKASGKLAGTVTGHATVGGTLVGKTNFVSAITGHATVGGTVKGAGALAGAITGHASVQLLLKLQSIISRTATVGGTLTGKGALADSISGHASILGNRSATGILSSPITRQASVSGTVTGTGNVLTSINTPHATVGVVNNVKSIIGNVRGQASVSATLNAFISVHSSITGQAFVLIKNVPFVPNPVQLGQSVGRGFACSASNPALILTYQNALQTFSSGLPVPPIGTPDGWGNLGQRVMMGQLLLAPGNGRLPGRSLAAVASGDVTIPFGSSSVSVNFVLNQNYFTITDQTITTYSVPMSTLSIPAPLFPGTYPWSISCRLSDNGSNNGFAQGNFTITINGVTTNGVASSNFNPSVQPQFQLSMGVQFDGAAGPNPFQARMIQFELQQA